MPLVIIESPFAGDAATVAANVRYARRCLADSLARGESPFASHLLYTQPGVLDDTDPAQREQGIAAGLRWQRAADLVAVYIDRGITAGMVRGIARASALGVTVVYRSIVSSPLDSATSAASWSS